MTTYDDPSVALDDSGITIKNHQLPGRSRHIRYADVEAVAMMPLGFFGRHRLVGIGPFRPRHFFHWDRKRAAKSHALSLDLGRPFRIAITPDDPVRVHELIRDRIEEG